MTKTMDFIPGNVLLGAFASNYINKNKIISDAHKDEQFYKWFLLGDIIFSNAYLLVNDEKKEIKLCPSPMSVQTDKAEKNIYNLIVMDDDLDEPTKEVGYYSYFSGNKIIKQIPEKQISFHHWRKERLKGNSSEGGIFNYESLTEGQTFWGNIYGEKTDLEQIKEKFGDKITIQIGRSKNTQYGQAEVNLLDIEKFNPSIYFENDNLEDNEILLTLTSPVILMNKFGYPEVSLEILREYLEDVLNYNKFNIEQSYAKVESIEGHVSVWKLKKTLEKAFCKGATFKIIFEDSINENLKEKLQQLMINGIGERKNEGFGRVAINWAVNEQYINKELKMQKTPKPSKKPSNIVSNVFVSIIKNNISKFITNEAVSEVSNYSCQSLPNSFLGRLELMLKNANDADEFVKSVHKLRDTAKDKLKTCRNKRQTLLQTIINNNTPNWEQVLRKNENINDLEKMAKEIDYNFKEDKDFTEEIYKKYWLTFFRTIRKLNKEKGGV
ncbi:MAG: hypothetical protein K9L56_07120 [Clostridiales bacterium]|nr:hypothetical protein [Clostridiales bacterium]